jgi:hypothetical protein
MYQPASPLSGQCDTYTRKANGTYLRCRNRAAVERNGKRICYSCNVTEMRSDGWVERHRGLTAFDGGQK